MSKTADAMHAQIPPDMAAAYQACHGAPRAIQPGAVKAMAEVLEGVLRVADRKTVEFDAAREALAMYYGEEREDEN